MSADRLDRREFEVQPGQVSDAEQMDGANGRRWRQCCPGRVILRGMNRTNLLRLLVGLVALVTAAPPATSAANPDELTTIAEQSGFKRTGRYDEVERLCAAFAAHWPGKARCFEFGRSPENRPLLALAVSDDGVFDPESVRTRRRPVVLFQGGIHAGEIDGKDAGFVALRDMLEGRESRGALSRTTVLFVPVFNVDGHERFGAWNRPNQRGPEEMGWRATAQNLNLNRDYTKAAAPEMRAMLALLNEWDPILYTDLHVTDGAQLREDVSVEVEPGHGWDPQLGTTGHALRDDVLARLKSKGFHALPFYPSFVAGDDPDSGLAVGVGSPRFSTSYWATRNRFGALVETHSWQEYPRRVAATRETIHAMVELAARDGGTWLEAAQAADARARLLGGKPVPLSFKNTDAVQTVDLRGYEYTREASAVSGQTWIRYDPTKPTVWRLPLKYEVQPALTVSAPATGYVVPSAHAAWLSEKLALHGIEFQRVAAPQPASAVQTFRADKTTVGAGTFEGRPVTTVEGAWRDDQRDIGVGALFVPIAQPKARLVMSLLEPQAPDSFASWGYFSAAFERKEYMENYVTEAVARQMLAQDAKLKQEFERRLREDAAFAASPDARLEFFYRRHPSWDERYGLYPVYRK
jgi:murein tripeptide amidase MpaA